MESEWIIRGQEPHLFPDRQNIDDVIFDAIGLTMNERKEVYWSVCKLAKNRLDKAGIVGASPTRTTNSWTGSV